MHRALRKPTAEVDPLTIHPSIHPSNALFGECARIALRAPKFLASVGGDRKTAAVACACSAEVSVRVQCTDGSKIPFRTNLY